MAQLVHECVPQRRATFFQQLSADGELTARMGVPAAPGAHVHEQGHELDGRFREAVDPFLPVFWIASSRQQARRRQALQPVREDIRGDAFLALCKQLSIVASIPEHDVTDDDQAPAVAELFERQVDRAAGSPCLWHRRSPAFSDCNMQVVPVEYNYLQSTSGRNGG